jgi:hypothetical protein
MSSSRAFYRWRQWSILRRALVVMACLFGAMFIAISAFTWAGVSASLEARRSAKALQEELSILTPLDLVDVTAFQSIATQLEALETTTGRARSRLVLLRAFHWIPLVGNRISDGRKVIELSYLMARIGRDLTDIYQVALSESLDQMGPDEASAKVSNSIRRAVSQFERIQVDLKQVGEILGEVGETTIAEQYISSANRFLPAIEAATYISRIKPEVVGDVYVVGRELSEMRHLVNDPLVMLADPSISGDILSVIANQSNELGRSLTLVRMGAEQTGLEETSDPSAVLNVLRLIEQGATLLQHISAGAGGLVEVAQAIDSYGFLSPEFGATAGMSLERAEEQLTLAHQKTSSFQEQLSMHGIEAGQYLPASILGTSSQSEAGTSGRIDVLLKEIGDTTRFLQYFLGYHGPRTYLLLGQNQDEIRATGGFIGIALEATIEEGVLGSLTYKDSTSIDASPYTNNPHPPEPIYWYLWMERLLFRDSNWDPHFPASAAQVAELYQIGQGIKVDGVLAGTKSLMLDLVKVYGDVTVPGVEGFLTRNLASSYAEGILNYECDVRHVSYRGKRCFDEDLFFALKERSTSIIAGDLKKELIQTVQDHLRRKNLLIHVFDPDEGSFLWDMGWNGSVQPVDHDFLMLIDSSLPGHSSSLIQRTLEYRVTLNPGHKSDAAVRVRYDNVGIPKDLVCRQGRPSDYDCFWNYFRLYLSPLATSIELPPIPLHEGSEKLIWGYTETDSASITLDRKLGASHLTELGGFIVVEPGSTTTIPISFRLSKEAIRSTADNTYEYRLLIQKQSGIDKDQITVAIDLPKESELLYTSTDPKARRGEMLLFEFPLVMDTVITVSFRTP